MEQLLEDIKNGNKEAFTEFIMQNQQKYYKVAKTIIYDDDDIADCLQNTLLNAYKNVKKVKNMNYFNTWIIRILINECKKMYRKNKKVEYLDENIEVIGEVNITEDNVNFYYIMNHLEKKDQQIFILYYVAGFSIKEIRQSIAHK